MSILKTLVVPIDFSDTSRQAFRCACALARDSRSHIHLLHVLPDPLRQPWITEAPGVDYVAIADRWRAEAQAEMRAWIGEAGLPVEAVTPVVLLGTPAEVILEYADAQEADVIVMGAHGESAVTRFFLGSVADRVVRRARRPVLTIPRGCVPPLAVRASEASVSM